MERYLKATQNSIEISYTEFEIAAILRKDQYSNDLALFFLLSDRVTHEKFGSRVCRYVKQLVGFHVI